MQILDRHITRSFLEPFLVAIAVIVGLFIVANAFSDLDEYLDQAGNVGQALRRMGRIYLVRIPVFLVPVLPIAMLIGAAYGISQLSGHNELLAIQACGISFWRFLAPVYGSTVVIALLGLGNRELLVPAIEKLTAPHIQIWTGKGDKMERITDNIASEKTQYVMYYNAAKKRATSVTVIFLSDNTKVTAQEAEPTEGGWLLKNVKIGGKSLDKKLWETSLKTEDVELAILFDRSPEMCPLQRLRQLIRDNPNELRYRLLYHNKLMYPFIGIVLVGLGLPFVIGSERVQRSRMLGVGVCVIIAGVFYTVQFITNDLGENGQIPAQLAAWLPVLIFGSLGIYLLETVHT